MKDEEEFNTILLKKIDEWWILELNDIMKRYLKWSLLDVTNCKNVGLIKYVLHRT